MKFVEARPDQQLAREVAVRSNNQNPVTPRNLRARDGKQLAIEEEFRQLYPSITYEIRPDAAMPSAADTTIQNDYAAQLLCAVFNRRPWLAIKRTTLFEVETYRMIFSRSVTADHVVLVYSIAKEVQNQKQRFPEPYLRSWQLTRLTGVYLVGELLRADSAGEELLLSPQNMRLEPTNATRIIRERVRFAAAAMKRRHDKHRRGKMLDDFKVEFKREEALRTLAGDAREAFVTYQAVELD